MNQISHKQAIHWIDLRLDGLLTERQLFLLDEHLRSCNSCSAYATEIEQVPGHLQTKLHARWDEKPGPSPKVMQHVATKAKWLPLANRIGSGIRLFGSAAALLILGLVINLAISRLPAITPAIGTQAANNMLQQVETGLLAFTSDQNGNADIYTMYPDGSGLTNLTNNPARDINPCWSPDGKRIAFESDRDGSMHIYSMNADGSDVIRLTDGKGNYVIGTAGTLNYTPWSPDGTKLIFLDRAGGAGKLYVTDANGENKTLLSEPGGVYYSSWSPDGQRVAFIAGNPDADKRLYIVNADGSNPIDLGQSLPENENIDAYNGGYHWSQDGQSIFFSTYQLIAEGQGLSIVYEFSLLDNQLTERVRSGEPIIDWWQDTSFIAPHSYDRLAPMTFLRGDGTSTTFKPFEPCESVNKPGYSFDSQRSSHGNLVISAHCPEGGWWLYWANPDGTVTKQLLNAPIAVEGVHFFGITWSPDDRFITFYDTSGTFDLYILDVEAALQDPSTQPVKATTTKSGLYNSSWQPVVSPTVQVVEQLPTPVASPTVQVIEEQPTPMATSQPQPQPSPRADDRLLAFASDQNGNSDIYTMHADGSELTNLTNNPAFDGDPSWSLDGKQIAFISDRNGLTQIFLMDADGSNLTQVTEGEMDHRFENVNPWSPDGTRLIVTERTPLDSSEHAPGNGEWTLYVVSVDGKSKTPLASVPDIYSNPSWSPDGEHIAFVMLEPQGDRNMARIQVVDADGDNLTNVTKLLPADENLISWEYSWSPDGQSISFVAGRSAWETGSGSSRYAAYEATLDGETLTERATSSNPMGDWWEGTSFILGFEGSPFTWLRPDGTYSTLDPFEKCSMGENSEYGYTFERSRNGNLLIGLSCANGDLWLYWANPDGTVVKQLLDSPITAKDSSAPHLTWSPDDRFITFNIDSSNKLTDMYILNVETALNDPSTQPLKVTTSGGSSLYNSSWQPRP